MRIRADFPDFRRDKEVAERVLLEFPKYAADATLRFSREAFRRGGWMDTRFERWAPRKRDKSKRGVLIGKGSGALRRGLAVSHQPRSWTISSDRPYAKIHNEGGKVSVTVTKKMRKFFWAMHYKARTKKDKAFWKGMALTKKKKLTYTMPKRQFMGRSQVLDRRLALHLDRALAKVLG